MIDQEQFERRLLALVRDYVDHTDELYPDGYEIEDFMVVYHLRIAPTADESLRPWHGGQRPGWWPGVALSSSTRSYWQDEAMLVEALDRVRDVRLEEDEDEEAPAEDEDS